jgi:thiol-disulfide isomerase/thioredoxin/Rps23 Pro-64 3,4-dihydroxylase Tpa1-like proline 4-hydroxylase
LPQISTQIIFILDHELTGAIMRYLFSILLFVLILFPSCSTEPEFRGIFSTSPDKSNPGDEITILYLADSTNLKGAETIEATAYFYGVKLNETHSAVMEKSGAGWITKIKTGEDTRGLLIKFKDQNDNIDNNSKLGYAVHLFDNDGNILAGSRAGLAEALNTWGNYYSDLERDDERAIQLLTEEFENNPSIKKEYLDTYFSVISRLDAQNKNEIIRSELEKIDNEESEEALTILANGYKSINDTVKSEQFSKKIEENFPKGEFVQRERYREFYLEKEIDKKIEMALTFEKEFPESDFISTHYDIIANYYRDNNQFEKAKEFLKENLDKPSTYRFYSVTDRMFTNKADLNTARDIAALGVERGRKELQSPQGKQPKYLSVKSWEKEREYLLGLNLYAEGKALFLMDQKSEALPKLEEAVKLTEKEEVELNEIYADALMADNQHEKALAELMEFFEKGKSTEAMKELMRSAYVNTKGSEEGYTEYISKLEASAKESLVEKLKLELINEPAPDFNLVDLQGNSVSLSSLKGKTIMIDFWATWCGPCLNSFPGMKNAVEKYSDDENVKFLFVNSWERIENKKENAEQFIAKTKYPFHVLLDLDNKVIESFKVSGIPTKFLIDKNGNIRFKSVGFAGNTDQMVEEISTMISMIN